MNLYLIKTNLTALVNVNSQIFDVIPPFYCVATKSLSVSTAVVISQVIQPAAVSKQSDGVLT